MKNSGYIPRVMKKCLLTVIAFSIGLVCLAQAPFVTTWKTDNPGSSCNSCVEISTSGSGYNYDIDWNNDGNFEETGVTGNVSHNFGAPGTYTIQLKGDFPKAVFGAGDAQKLIDIEQWGAIEWEDLSYGFMPNYGFITAGEIKSTIQKTTQMIGQPKDILAENIIMC